MRVALVVLVALFPVGLRAQDTGQIAGTVLDGASAAPVTAAQVSLADTELGTLTDLKGRYHIAHVPAGTYTLVAQVLGYATKRVTGIRVRAGEATRLDVTLEQQAVQVADLTVSVEAERGTVGRLLTEQRTAIAVTDGVASQDISRSPDSHAAETARRITGVTVSEGKYVYVRGLGERYSQTSLSGSPLPSPEPERSVVPLDLFPSGFLETLRTQKTYTPDQPGDFSGGSVEIEMKEFPEQLTFKVSFGSSFNSESHYSSNYLSAPGGRFDWLGFDDGTRDLPNLVKQELGGLDGDRLPSDPATRERLGESFLGDLSVFSPSSGTTPVNRGGSLSVGNRTRVFGKDFGYLLAGTYSNSFTRRDQEIERKWRSSAFDPSIQADRRVPNVDYTFDTGTQEARWGTIGNFTVLLSPSHQLHVKSLYNRNATHEARLFQGANREDLGGEIVDERIRFISRSLEWGQLGGDHDLGSGVRLEWKGVVAHAGRDEPGLRESISKRPFNADPDDPFLLDNTGESARYLFSELDENDLNGSLDLSLPLPGVGDRDATLTIGGSARRRTRDFAARRFRFEFLSGSSITDLGSALDEESIVGTLTGVGQFRLTDIVEPGDVYDARDVTVGGYGMFDIAVTDWLRVVAGGRIERYDLELDTRQAESLSDLEATDFLPAANITVQLNDEMNIRAAASRTLDRPEFRELAPFQFTEAASMRQLFGNPDLEIAKIVSLDLRWEWFFGFAEAISVSGFYKDFDQPIEQVFIATASSGYSYQNAESGWLAGVELGVRKNLGFLGDAFDDFSLLGNFSWIESEVDVRSGGIFDPTNLARPLEGQAEWVANTSLFYASPGGSTEAGLFFNMRGDRIVAAGGAGVPDIVERPRPQLDLTLRQALGRRFALSLNASNLLDSDYMWEQSANGITQIQREYRTGQSVSVSLSYGN